MQKAQRRLRPAPGDTFRPYLFVKTEHRLQRVDLAEVRYLEGLQNYVVIHTTTSEKIIARQTLSSLEASLPTSAFARVHKSFIVALAHIHSVERGRIFIQASADAPLSIPVGEAYHSAFYGRL